MLTTHLVNPNGSPRIPTVDPKVAERPRHSHLGRSSWRDHQLLTRPLGWEATEQEEEQPEQPEPQIFHYLSG